MEKLRQRRARDAAAPELASDPVADETVGAVGPRPDVPGDAPAEENCANGAGGGGHDFRPVGHERVAIARGKRGHVRSFGVELMLEKDGQVTDADLAEGNLGRDDGGRVHSSGREVMV